MSGPPQYRTTNQRVDRLEAWQSALDGRLETIERLTDELRALVSNIEAWNANFEARLNTVVERLISSKDFEGLIDFERDAKDG